MSELITPGEAANKVGVSVQAVYLRAESGKLRKQVKYGRMVVYASDVELWRKERIASATAQIERAE